MSEARQPRGGAAFLVNPQGIVDSERVLADFRRRVDEPVRNLTQKLFTEATREVGGSKVSCNRARWLLDSQHKMNFGPEVSV